MGDTLHHLSRFLFVMLAVDALGLGVWAILPETVGIRQLVLLGTLIVAPLIAFLVTYGPEFQSA
ncbi:hypothetical protein C499_14665 [Halogeometricum borinquense DSM 11551]|uniref:Uncharacterized protein n=2 Tax=Halogeometricum borinquense TaxID=60847 RepID=E4NL57_HALBP|nr:hypothetical protein [Halogeometricum borinquense]ADQ68306.1 hypothetical protein Hbor_27620 [Halogeometricum borinquense DSM 11551]ELY24652.1 hypothetical protein C499_14665 [Halogeometricum borinquense DSM 11551]RYJ12808.1 hypothetical protein ELS19_01680 [Halogeometricum borinquense]